MIIHLVWASETRVYHESLRGNADKSSPNNVGKKAQQRIDRLITHSRKYHEAILYIDAIVIGCRCKLRPNIIDADCHAFHNDIVAMPDELEDAASSNPLQLSNDELQAVPDELLAELQTTIRRMFVESAKRRVAKV